MESGFNRQIVPIPCEVGFGLREHLLEGGLLMRKMIMLFCAVMATRRGRARVGVLVDAEVHSHCFEVVQLSDDP